MNAKMVETFLKRGAVSVPFQSNGCHIALGAIVGFKQFLNEDEGEKRRWTIVFFSHADTTDFKTAA